jgi:hypothetical protein
MKSLRKGIAGLVLLVLSVPFAPIGFIAHAIFAGLRHGWNTCQEMADWIQKS